MAFASTTIVSWFIGLDVADKIASIAGRAEGVDHRRLYVVGMVVCIYIGLRYYHSKEQLDSRIKLRDTWRRIANSRLQVRRNKYISKYVGRLGKNWIGSGLRFGPCEPPAESEVIRFNNMAGHVDGPWKLVGVNESLWVSPWKASILEEASLNLSGQAMIGRDPDRTIAVQFNIPKTQRVRYYFDAVIHFFWLSKSAVDDLFPWVLWLGAWSIYVGGLFRSYL